MNTTILVFIFCGLLASFSSQGYSLKENCPRIMKHLNNLQIVSSFESDLSECWFTIDNNKGYRDLIYRSYLLTTSGHLMVFNSYGKGTNSTSTGARQFFFFPRSEFLNGIKLDPKSLTIPITQLATFQFDTTTLSLIDQPGLTFKTDPKVNRQNRGGVEVVKYAGVYLDSGYRLGDAPNQDPGSWSTFVNAEKQNCVVRNRDIFDYKDSDVFLHSDSVLKNTVKSLCPKFRWP
jgi:hypothetical protein